MKKWHESDWLSGPCHFKNQLELTILIYFHAATPSHLQMLQSMVKAGPQRVHPDTKAIAMATMNVPDEASLLNGGHHHSKCMLRRTSIRLDFRDKRCRNILQRYYIFLRHMEN